ncbi:hypothetical protein B0I33_10949 [Prauserella shujinwangii]|uniref:Uncharacterized protein n=1 Tax=Prauserella shujinwangii TaxID=1453103 RepID=A0A2T0LPV7_9PSEU|nr:DUF6218 family protein [Prauserella shujinwangii]PRX45386.1 hypothetical protein B0I33_10949 [Prauserella shujinwangii]
MSVPETQDGLGGAAEAWAPGSAILATGAGEDGDSVAVWHVSPGGVPTGAWVVPREEAFGSPDAARRLLVVVERRAVTAADPRRLPELLGGLTRTSGVDRAEWWRDQVFSPVDAFAEIVARRAEFERTVADTRASGKNVSGLDWPREFRPADVPGEFGGLRRLASLAEVPGKPVVAEALTVARVLGWLVRLWTETEQVKNRRDYLRAAHGAPEPLPPSWFAAVRIARSTTLPL